MFVSPIRQSDPPNRKAWDNLTIYRDGAFYAFFNTITVGEGSGFALDIAKSEDGVHWDFIARDLLPVEGAHAGYGLLQAGDRVYYYPTATRRSPSTGGDPGANTPGTGDGASAGSRGPGGVHFKVYASSDFLHWEHLGDEYDVKPDPRYYRARWEEVCILEDTEVGETVYYGYVSSEVRADVGAPSLGLAKSRDGVNWQVLPPPAIEWGELPPQHMEVTFCEKFDGRYYLNLGGRLYLDSYGYSLYTFVSDSPAGPFTPDLPKFRLAGTSRRDVTWLGHPIHSPHGLLLSLWHSAKQVPEIPSRNLSVGPFKRLVCEDGHLRLRYWEGNEGANGSAVPVDRHMLDWIFPAPRVRRDGEEVSAGDGDLSISAGRDGALVMIDHRFSPTGGFVVTGRLTARERRGSIATHQHAAAAGFFFETRATGRTGAGYAIVPDTLGVTRGGILEYADHKITDHDIYAEAGQWLVRSRSGDLKGLSHFEYDDQVGPFGHASYCGIRHDRQHDFRLIARGDFIELYIDDYYVQTYVLPDGFTGRVGFLCFDGTYRASGIEAWDLAI